MKYMSFCPLFWMSPKEFYRQLFELFRITFDYRGSPFLPEKKDPAMTKRTILVVEDEFITATDIRNSLQGMGYDVPVIADNGEEALRKADEMRPSLVLMDIGLRGKMTGIEAGKQIRERFDIPVIYLTAHSDESTFWNALSSEPYGYIIKPFEARELQFNIEMALHKHGQRHPPGRDAVRETGQEIPVGVPPEQAGSREIQDTSTFSRNILKRLPLIILVVCLAFFLAFVFHPPGFSPTATKVSAVPFSGNTSLNPTPASPSGETQYETNVRVVKEIALGYHDTHTYLGTQTGQPRDMYVCIDMAKDVWNMVKTRGINAVIVVGNVTANVTRIPDVDHAWVLAEVGPLEWLAIETTGGFVVTDEENPRYYTGMKFDSPATIKDYACGRGYCWSDTCVNDRCLGCSPGFVLGTDLQCHPECGSSYCTGNSVCVEDQCVRCGLGYVLGTDNRCHPTCMDTTHYCLDGFVCGSDNRCHHI
jgi:CheY-like chemotaxis protein